MGPPPPSPRIEGQQAQQQAQQQFRANNRGRWPPVETVAAASAAPPISSYASLASGPPPSFAHKQNPLSSSNTDGSSLGGGGPPSPRGSGDFRRSSSPGAVRPTMGGSFRGGGGRAGGRFDRGGGSAGRFDRGGGRGLGRGPFRGGGRSSGGGRFGSYNDREGDRFLPSGAGPPRGGSLSGEPRPGGGRGGRGRGDPMDDGDFGGARGGGRFFRRGSGRDGGGRFDSLGPRGGRGRGRSYMDLGRGGSRGRGMYRGGRGRFYDEPMGRGRGSGSYGDNSSYSDGYYNDSGSYSGDYPDGPSGGGGGGREYDNNSGRFRRSDSSDGRRSASPHPTGSNYYPSRRPSYNESSEFRPSASPGGPIPPEEEGAVGENYPPYDDGYYPPGGQKRRREDYPPEPGEEPSKRPAPSRDEQSQPDHQGDSSEGAVTRQAPPQHKQQLPQEEPGTAEADKKAIPPPNASAQQQQHQQQEPLPGDPRRNDTRPQHSAVVEQAPSTHNNDKDNAETLDRRGGNDEGRYTYQGSSQPPSSFPPQDRPFNSSAPGGPPPRGSPQSTSRRVYENFDEFGDREFRGGPPFRGRGLRGRGRGFGRGGRGRGFEPGRGDFGGRDFGGRGGYGGPPPDRHPLSITVPTSREVPLGPRGPDPDPRTNYSQYADLGASLGPQWRRDSSSNLNAADNSEPHPPSPRDWRKPGVTPVGSGGPIGSLPPSSTTRAPVTSSYANLASAPPMRANPPVPTTIPTAGRRPPTPPPPPPEVEEKVQTPPPSPGPPSGVTVALTRLADLEAQMEFAYAKHILLQKRHELLMAQYDHLETLPVGFDAFEEEYKKFIGEKEENIEDKKKAGEPANGALTTR